MADDVPGGDLGVGGPADSPGEAGTTQPPEYPEEVDPSAGPLADDARQGDLRDPGAS